MIAALLLAGLPAVSGQQEASGAASLARINNARAARNAGTLQPSEPLDRLAASYLEDLLDRRALVPRGYGSVSERVLSEDVAAAMGVEGYRFRYTGLVVAYGESLANAMAVAAGSSANGPALLEPALSLAGVASSVIPPGDPWIAPPPGGVGRDIDLTGMTVIVVVTAGEYRAGS